jgi:hypothetical protein
MKTKRVIDRKNIPAYFPINITALSFLNILFFEDSVDILKP